MVAAVPSLHEGGGEDGEGCVCVGKGGLRVGVGGGGGTNSVQSD